MQINILMYCYAATYATLPIHTFPEESTGPTYAQYGIQLIILCCRILSFKKRHNDDVVAVAGVVVCTNLVLACRDCLFYMPLQLPYTHTSYQIIIHIHIMYFKYIL